MTRLVNFIELLTRRTFASPFPLICFLLGKVLGSNESREPLPSLLPRELLEKRGVEPVVPSLPATPTARRHAAPRHPRDRRSYRRRRHSVKAATRTVVVVFQLLPTSGTTSPNNTTTNNNNNGALLRVSSMGNNSSALASCVNPNVTANPTTGALSDRDVKGLHHLYGHDDELLQLMCGGGAVQLELRVACIRVLVPMLVL